MAFEVKIDVFLKAGVSDPEGATISEAARHLGHDSVRSVYAGKSYVLVLDEANRESAMAKAEELGTSLLSNPVIESFEVSVVRETAK